MRFQLSWIITIVALATASSIGRAQSITVTPHTAPGNAPPGKKLVYATGTYALMQGQTVNKVEAKWYKEVQSNLIWAGTVQDLTPANNAYTTA